MVEETELNGFYRFLESADEGFSDFLIRLDLRPFNSKHLFFSKCEELMRSVRNYRDLLLDDLQMNQSPLGIRNMGEIVVSRIYSEVEGSLNIENVPTTRKRFEELVMKDQKPITSNDKVIKNMARAIEFVLNKPAFTKENLLALYLLLSKDSLDYGDQLREGEYYRHEKVFIDAYEGCPYERIEECMDSLFEYVNRNLKSQNEMKFFLPHIAHYYIVYIHPHLDFNGRTARMVSFWVSLLMGNSYPPFLSDAINQSKGRYYGALSETRNAHNDLTYFLLYVMDISIDYFLAYRNIEHIDACLKEKGIILSPLDKDYIKRIMVFAKGPFLYGDFTSMNHIHISKQGALKILNRFVGYGILEVVGSSGNKKLFRLNANTLLYQRKKRNHQ